MSIKRIADLLGPGRRQRKSRAALLVCCAVASSVAACGGDGEQVDRAADSPEQAIDDEVAENYRQKVNQRVSGIVLSSLANEWGVSESQVECILADVRISQLENATSDPEVGAVFEKCDVDPAVTE